MQSLFAIDLLLVSHPFRIVDAFGLTRGTSRIAGLILFFTTPIAARASRVFIFQETVVRNR